jgi:high affinity Mn2+ porin
MRRNSKKRTIAIGATAVLACTANAVMAQLATNAVDAATNNVSPPLQKSSQGQEENWNWHVQNTDIVQGYPAFSAQYTHPGFNSLPPGGETRETVSADLMVGARLWHGAEAHVDGMMWQGYGVNNALGVDGFPNGEAFRVGTTVPNFNFTRVFIRQTIGLGGDQEDISDGDLTLSGKEDISRLTFTLGRFSVEDIFDNNAYANDARTQFMNWGLMANEAWDYPADAIGYTTGLAVELNQPQWTLRYGFFQMPRESNGTAMDTRYLAAWGMVTELERRYTIADHPGTIRLLAYLNRAHMGSYAEAVDNYNLNPAIPANIQATRGDRIKYGLGLNWEQEVISNVGVFSRLGWSNGQTEGWAFSDVDYSASLGLSVKGVAWHRPDDTYGLAGLANGISHVHQEFFADGGTGILAGDGALTYGWEKILETYYDFKIWKSVHGAFDYQFVDDPAFNAARGPVSVFAARLHWEF